MAATGKTTFARSVTALGAISSETTKALSRAAKVAWLLLPSSGSTPPTTSAPMDPELTASIICEVLRPISVGKESVFHSAAISTRAAASVTGRPPGRTLPIAPASNAPRSPARRGIHASFAPDESASAATALNAPALSAARSPTRITDLLVNDCNAIAAASCPGATFTNSAFNLSTAIDSLEPIETTFNARLRNCLLMRKKTIGDSSSGSKPTSRT